MVHRPNRRLRGFEPLDPRRLLAAVANDVDSPVLRLGSTAIVEGDVTNRQMLEFELSQASDETISFDFRLISDTATVRRDIRPRSGKVTFHPGQTLQRRAISVLGDTNVEANETVFVELGNPRGIFLNTLSLPLTILNDDVPIVSLVTTKIAESDTLEEQELTFRLSEPSHEKASFKIDVLAQLGSNRTPKNVSQFSVEFQPGELEQSITVPIVGDNVYTASTELELQFSQANGVSFESDIANIPIVEDDVAPTNIVYIMLDDADFHDFGYQSNDAVTPNIDQLRENGLALSQFYSASAICSPTRASVLTGTHPLRYGMNTVWPQEFTFVQDSKGLRGLPNDIPQMASELNDFGITSGHFGKWHVGLTDEAYRPTAMGFDEWNLPKGRLMKTDYSDRAHVFTGQVTESGSTQLDEPIHPTGFTTDRVIDFIDRQHSQGNPFFADVWFYAPHSPWVVPPGFDNTELGFDLESRRGKLLSMMHVVDQGIGQIVDALDERGILDETLIVVTSDNGGQSSAQAADGLLRGHKGSLFDGGIRVPFVAHWPDAIEPNSSNDSVMLTTDLLPTFAQLLGADHDDITALEQEIDGRSKAEAFFGDQTIPHDPIFWQINGSSKDQPGARDAYTFALRDGDYKIVKLENRDSYLMFNIRQDPQERKDLSRAEPERLAEMVSKLTEMRLEYSRVPDIPSAIAKPTVIPFDPRLDISSGEMTLVFDMDRMIDTGRTQVLFDKPDSWRITWDGQGKIKLEVTGVDRTVQGAVARPIELTAALPTGASEIAVVLGGFKNDHTAIELYVDGILADEIETEFRPWNVWSSKSPLRIGDEQVAIKNVRMHVSRFWPDEWNHNVAKDDSILGDANRDGIVTAHDLNIIGLNGLPARSAELGELGNGDFDDDQQVANHNIDILAVNWFGPAESNAVTTQTESSVVLPVSQIRSPPAAAADDTAADGVHDEAIVGLSDEIESCKDRCGISRFRNAIRTRRAA